MAKTNKQLLIHMMEYIRQIDEANEMFHADMETLKNNSVYRNAVALCVLQIGELAGNLTEDFQQSTSKEIPWRAVRGLRNIVAHHYGKIDYESLWETISMDIPELNRFCNKQIALLNSTDVSPEETIDPEMSDQML